MNATAQQYSIRTAQSEPVKSTVDLELNDNRGRKIGLRFLTSNITFSPVPENYKGAYYRQAPGDFIAVNAQVTRNGSDYGAMQQSRYFPTQGEADAYKAKRINDAKKANAKKFPQA